VGHPAAGRPAPGGRAGRGEHPGADEVSITLIDGDKPSTVAFTGGLAVQLDERQYEDGFGPCMDAARTGGTLALLDLEGEQRYTGFVGAARRAGVTGTLSVGMPVPGRVVGGLNIYRLGDGRGGAEHLDQDSVPVAELFAGYAAVALANAELLQSTQRLAQQMREAMTSRAAIEQAKGVLVAREGMHARRRPSGCWSASLDDATASWP
jgi:GAF domain-containing protein